jgi:hypothetical protein
MKKGNKMFKMGMIFVLAISVSSSSYGLDKIPKNADGPALFHLKSDPSNNYGDCKINGSDVGLFNQPDFTNETAMREFILSCNSKKSPAPKPKDYEEAKKMFMTNARGNVLYNLWSDPDERAKNVLTIGLLGDLYRKTGSSNEKLKACVMAYKDSSTAQCAEFFE